MHTDLKLHVKGFLTFNSYLYKDVREHSIEYKDNICIIKFYYTHKAGKYKGKELHYAFAVPIQNLYYVGVRLHE